MSQQQTKQNRLLWKNPTALACVPIRSVYASQASVQTGVKPLLSPPPSPPPSSPPPVQHIATGTRGVCVPAQEGRRLQFVGYYNGFLCTQQRLRVVETRGSISRYVCAYVQLVMRHTMTLLLHMAVVTQHQRSMSTADKSSMTTTSSLRTGTLRLRAQRATCWA